MIVSKITLRVGMRWLLAAALAASLAAAAAAVEPGTETANAIRIDVKNFTFAPTSTTVKAGATVIWLNSDQEPHTVVSVDGLFRSGAIDTGESFSFKFEKPGTYQYLCTIHPHMVGTVVVQ
jgi:plastocyanin